MTESEYLTSIIKELQEKLNEQKKERINQLEWKVEEMHSEYTNLHDPYLNG